MERAIDLFFKSVGLIPHVEFFDVFVNSTIHRIPRDVCPFRHTIQDGEHFIRLECTEFGIEKLPTRNDDRSKPLRVDDARGMMHKTYGVRVFGIVRITSETFPLDQTFEVPVFTLPVCVGSVLCHDRDEKILNGYFVLNGISRAIITQEQNVTNKVLVNRDNKRKFPQCVVRSKHPVFNTVGEFAFIRKSETQIVVKHHFFAKNANIDAWKFLLAIGVPHEIVCAEFGIEINQTRSEVLLELGAFLNRHNSVDDLESRTKSSLFEMFPHVPPDRAPDLVLYMIRELKSRPTNEYDSNDDMCNKRFETCNKLMEDLIVNAYSALLVRWREKLSALVWMPYNVVNKIRSVLFRDDCDHAIDGCFKSGTWVIPMSTYPKKDVVEELRRENVWVSLSQLRRTTSCNVGTKKGKQIEPRLMHPTMFGKTCQSETPEGEKAGIAKNLCVFSKYSRKRSAVQIVKFLNTLPEGDLPVFVDGVLLARKLTPKSRDELVRLRRCGQIAPDVSVSCSKVLDVRCDEGRIIECVLVAGADVRELEKCETIWDATKKGLVEFLDAEEEWTNCKVTEAHAEPGTHVRLHGCALFGILATTVPFGNHNMGARITFYTHMLKRIVAPRIEREITFDTKSYELVYPQKPLVVSSVSNKALEASFGPDTQLQFGGQNLVVMIASDPWTGEDAVILSDTAFGAGWTITYDTYKYVVDLKHEELIQKRPGAKGDFTTSVPAVDTRVKPNDDILFKRRSDTLAPKCERVSALQNGWVDAVAQDVDAKKHELSISIRIRRVRAPAVGDKVNQRPGQKGTVARIKPRYELPYSKETGMTPDLIINPNAFPSRMTISFMFEGAESKRACFTGKQFDASPFGGEKPVAESPVEVFICPLTGNEMVPLWMAPMFVQINAKFSSDALFSRALGPRSIVTRQPKHGRANEGAPKFGEMEVWGAMTHGASEFTFDRLARCSDFYKGHVCPRCGRFSPPQQCDFCHVAPYEVETKYAWKLIHAHLLTSGIDVRYKR